MSEDTAPAIKPDAPRIGDGSLSVISGIVLAGLAVFASLAAAGGSSGAGTASVLCAGLAVFLIWLGFLKRMFHMIERRLIDIQDALHR